MVVDSVELQLYAVLGISPLLHIQSSWFLTLRELHKWRFGIEQRGTGLNSAGFECIPRASASAC